MQSTWYKAHQRIKLMTNEYNYSKLFLKNAQQETAATTEINSVLVNNVPWFK